MAQATVAQYDAYILALEGLVDYQRWDEDPEVFLADGLPSTSNAYALGQACPPDLNTDGNGAMIAAFHSNATGADVAGLTTDVPTVFAGDTSSKRYFYGSPGKGVTSSGEPTNTIALDTIQVSQFRVAAGTGNQVFAWLDGAGTGTGSQNIRAVIYSDDGASQPATLLGESDEVAVTDGQAFGRVEFPFSTPYTIPTDGLYWIGFHGSSNTNTVRIGTAAGPLLCRQSNTDTYSGGAASTWVGTASTPGTKLMACIEINASRAAGALDVSAHPAADYVDPVTVQHLPYGNSLNRTIRAGGASGVMNQPLSCGGWFKFTALPQSGIGNRDQHHGIMGYGSNSGAGDIGMFVGLRYYDATTSHLVASVVGASDSTTAYWNGNRHIASDPIIVADTWYQITFRAYDSTIELWLDGVLVASRTDWSSVTSFANINWMWGKISTDFSISGHETLLRGYMHRTWLTQEKVTDQFITDIQGGILTTLDAMACDTLTLDASSCDTLSMSGQTADTPTLDPMVCDT